MESFDNKTLIIKSEQISQLYATEVGWKVATVLMRELKLLLSRANPQSLEVVDLILSDATSDVFTTVGQLSTLNVLTKRYMEKESFHWFVNQFIPLISPLTPPTPEKLDHMFSAYESESYNLFLKSEERRNPELAGFLKLTEEEEAIKNFRVINKASLCYLNLRPWLTEYLFALKAFRYFYSIQELFSAVAPETLEPDTNPNRSLKD